MIDDIMHLGLLDEGDIELDRAALEIARLDHPETDLAGYLDLLDQMTARLRARAERARTPAQQAAALAEVLAEEAFMRGRF